MDRFSVSVIIPCLKGRSNTNLDPLLHDIETQSLQPHEVHVIEAVSPQARARNMGAQRAIGDVLVFVDCDVRLGHKRVLEAIVGLLRNRLIGMAGPAQLLPPDSSPFQRAAGRQIPRSVASVVSVVTDSDFVTACFALRRALFCQLGGFNEDLVRGEDGEMRLRLRRSGFRVVVAPNAWHYHPQPANLKSLCGISFRNGRQSAETISRAPWSALENPDGHVASFVPQRTSLYRACRHVARFVVGLVTLRWIGLVAQVSYLAGYTMGRVRMSFGQSARPKMVELKGAETSTGSIEVPGRGCGRSFLVKPGRGLSRIRDHVRRALWNSLFGDFFREATAFHLTAQWLPEEAIRELQWEQVQVILRAAYSSSAFYRGRLETAGWPVVTPEGFQEIPPLTRGDLKGHSGRICSSNGWRGIYRASGGSTGPSVTVPFDRRSYAWHLAGLWRGLQWWGVRLSDRGFLLLGPSQFSPFRALGLGVRDWMMNWRRLPVNDWFDRNVRESLDRIDAFGPRFLYGYPSAVHRLARIIRQRTGTLRTRLTVIILTGEPVYAFQRLAIEEAFQCPVAVEYGSGELGCLAFQCPRGILHATAENVFLEIVPRESTGFVGAGVILATHLRNSMFPLIRYETGDIGILTPGLCSCGRGLPSLRILGRTMDCLVGARGSASAYPLVDRFFSMLPDYLHGRVQVTHGMAGSVTLQVEGGTMSADALADAGAVGGDAFGPEWEVKVSGIPLLPRLSSGKLPYFLRTEG